MSAPQLIHCPPDPLTAERNNTYMPLCILRTFQNAFTFTITLMMYSREVLVFPFYRRKNLDTEKLIHLFIEETLATYHMPGTRLAWGKQRWKTKSLPSKADRWVTSITWNYLPYRCLFWMGSDLSKVTQSLSGWGWSNPWLSLLRLIRFSSPQCPELPPAL